MRVQLALWLNLLWSMHVRSRRSGLLARMGLWSSCGGKWRNMWNFGVENKKEMLPNKTILKNNLDKCVDTIYSLYHWHLFSASDGSRTDAEIDRTKSISPNLTDWPQPLEVRGYQCFYQSKFSTFSVKMYYLKNVKLITKLILLDNILCYIKRNTILVVK